MIAEPLEGCQTFTNGYAMKNKIVFVLRGQCMFIDKVFRITILYLRMFEFVSVLSEVFPLMITVDLRV